MDDESQMLNTLKKLNENSRKNRRLRELQEEKSKSMESQTMKPSKWYVKG